MPFTTAHVLRCSPQIVAARRAISREDGGDNHGHALLIHEARPRSAGGTFLIVWPEPNGESRWTHDAQPDRTVMQTRAGDILVNHGQRLRVRAVKIYRSAPVLDERTTYWCRSVDDAIWDASR